MFQQYQTPNYSGFWLRFAAYLIDYVVITVVTCPLGMIAGVMGAIADQNAGAGAGVAGRGVVTNVVTVIVYVISLVGTWLYSALLESSGWQGTIGKKILGLRVTDAAGERINFGRASGRFFAKLIGIVPMMFAFAAMFVLESIPLFAVLMIVTLVVSLGAYAMAAFTERKQALHDLMAGTLVLQGGAPGAGGGGVTLDQMPPPPPTDYTQAGGYGGAGGGNYGGNYGGGYGN